MNKTVLIVMAVVLVLIVGAMGGGFYMMWSKLSTLESTQVGEEEAEIEDVETETIGAIFPLDTFIVNLADDSGKRYLRVTMNLEIKAAEMEAELNKRLPQIRDVILTVLPTKRFEDIQTVDGKLGLRNEIISRLNQLLSEESVSNIYFTEFVVQ